MQESYEELLRLEDKISFYTQKLKQLASNDLNCQRLLKIIGVGNLTATAVIANVGDANNT